MKRVLLASILGAIAMFAWTSIAHMVLPLGATGVSQIPNETPVLSAMNASIGTQHGLYMYPALGVPPNASMKEMRDAMPAYQQKITFGEIVRITDGPLAMLACASLTRYQRCTDCDDEKTCAIRRTMRSVRDATAAILDHTTLSDALKK